MAGQLSAPYCGESAQKRRTALGLQKRWANICGTTGRGNIKEQKIRVCSGIKHFEAVEAKSRLR